MNGGSDRHFSSSITCTEYSERPHLARRQTLHAVRQYVGVVVAVVGPAQHVPGGRRERAASSSSGFEDHTDYFEALLFSFRFVHATGT